MIYHWLVSASFKFIMIIEINYRVPKSLACSIRQLKNNIKDKKKIIFCPVIFNKTAYFPPQMISSILTLKEKFASMVKREFP